MYINFFFSQTSQNLIRCCHILRHPRPKYQVKGVQFVQASAVLVKQAKGSIN